MYLSFTYKAIIHHIISNRKLFFIKFAMHRRNYGRQWPIHENKKLQAPSKYYNIKHGRYK